MTKEDLIFLGACSILSSLPSNSISVFESDTAAKWSEYIYNQTHPAPITIPVAEEWEVQKLAYPESTKWMRSENTELKGTFPIKESAQLAMDLYGKGAYDYRLRRIDTNTAEPSQRGQERYMVEYQSPVYKTWWQSGEAASKYSKEEAQKKADELKQKNCMNYRIVKAKENA